MPDFIPFFCGPNLVETQLHEEAPWAFLPDQCQLQHLRNLPKTVRSLEMRKLTTRWSTYSTVGGMCRLLRVGKNNPPTFLRGLVADYDTKASLDELKSYIDQNSAEYAPNFVEVSLGMKARFVWVFERELVVNGSKFCHSVIEKFVEIFRIRTLAAGFDPASTKPSQVWTNGGVWHPIKATPIAWSTVLGVAVDAGRQSASGESEVPIEVIAAEVSQRYPGRWQGDFNIGAVGVRFWDEGADCETGCQAKPDGMLCFTGPRSFMKWRDIFGADWVVKQRSIHLAKAAEGIYWDTRFYWELIGGVWRAIKKEDVTLRLKSHGLSSKPPVAGALSEVDRVVNYIQECQIVDGAVPLVNYRPGIVEIESRRLLNIYPGKALEPAEGQAEPERDFPWLHQFLWGLFDHPEDRSVEHFLAWLQRFYRAQLQYEKAMGQAVFLCGPRNNGKTLLSERIIRPLVGAVSVNPFDYMTGKAGFNSEIFSTPFLSINDEEAPAGKTEKARFLARIKSFAVNPTHMFHPKFKDRISIEWTGRILCTLNDDPKAAAILPEPNANTMDKLMFFGSRPFAGTWPENTEAIISKELPFFASWLLNWQPPPIVLSQDRMGVTSFFDRRILELCVQQLPGYNLRELLQKWCDIGAHWEGGGPVKASMRGAPVPNEQNGPLHWEGTPTDLLSEFESCGELKSVTREWDISALSDALVDLARLPSSGVIKLEIAGERCFRVDREVLDRKRSSTVDIPLDHE